MFDRTMRRLKFGWSMAGSSKAVVRRQPKLLVFPLLSGLALAGLFYLVYTQALVSFLRHGGHSPMVRSFVETV